MTDENYEARAQAHLASIKRDMRKTLEDAVVRAAHKVMAEFEAKSDKRLMEDWGPGPHEVHSLPAREPEPPAQQELPACLSCGAAPTRYVDEGTDFPGAYCDACGPGGTHQVAQEPDYKALYEKAVQQYNELADLMAEQSAPMQGWKLVPVEPTPEQIKSGNKVTWPMPCKQVYTAMLNAAPQPAQQEPTLCINPKVIDPATGKVRNGTGALTYSDTPCAGWSLPLYTSPPARKPLTHEQRVDLLAKFEAHKHEWHAPAILIDMVEAAHGIKGDA